MHKSLEHCFRAGLSLLLLLAPGMGLLAQDSPKKVSHAEALAAIASKVPPDFPPIARQLKIQGSVELELVVATDGTVEKVNIVSGNPVLTKPASDAAKKWKFKPFTADGQPIKALAPLTITFVM